MAAHPGLALLTLLTLGTPIRRRDACVVDRTLPGRFLRCPPVASILNLARQFRAGGLMDSNAAALLNELCRRII